MSRVLGPSHYVVEILTPKQSAEDFDAALAIFADRYKRIVEEGHIVSVPDNPLGTLHFTALEVIEHSELTVRPDQFLLHLNTFHRKSDLDEMLEQAKAIGVRNILCVSGDGGSRLPKLEPEDLHVTARTVTSVELLRYIESRHPGRFTLGAAFNQYEPIEDEAAKLERKIEAGARFVATQPVLSENQGVLSENQGVLSENQGVLSEKQGLSEHQGIRELLRRGMPVYLGAWMSRNIHLLSDCVGRPLDGALAGYDPVENLLALRDAFNPDGFYLSLMGFKRSLGSVLPLLKSA